MFITITLPTVDAKDAIAMRDRINKAVLRTDDRPAYIIRTGLIDDVVIDSDDPVRVILDLQVDGFVD